ncbi:hypothetical protein BKK79_24620 [Cupriavidus sp. USMAA2-4]|uniref:ATP synthase subunit b n=1 Tax=Cupriavidus malaysiensis TaxID=367825 RepID=A0ABN4TZF8_9BURK|nr:MULTISPECIES: F0F1 ATP synthase subunit delta [Cupriavidus]AOY95015.1 hypothetical protein BKK79_24620 [Cupriavidus sp. USMAA2-4]AOZ10521.1 hypothetical protein BKK80_33740 [Cupriavidus malaysiensis]
MRIDWWTLGLQAVNALVLVWILSRFLFRPVARIIAARQQACDDALAQARTARDEAGREREAAAAARAQAEAEHASAAAGAAAEAARLRDALAQSARAEVQAERAAAEADIAAARRAAVQRGGEDAARLALDIAARLFARLPREARIGAFIDGLAAAVAALPAPARAGLLQADAGLVLAAPCALAADELARCAQALGAALGAAPVLATRVDPGLVAGLALESDRQVIGNNVREDLARVRAALAQEHDDVPAA